mmetsp:Transcript_11975/g.23541  ORF Transcript_11975/g.23541 Transcript_11975/m.23541 type:complete len:195 (-) Transcript_11975:537-1121(-)
MISVRLFTTKVPPLRRSDRKRPSRPRNNKKDRVAWIPNKKTKGCMRCKRSFKMLVRRHHCRRCGFVVCGACSSQKLPAPGYKRPQRVCNSCHKCEATVTSRPSQTTLCSSPKDYYPTPHDSTGRAPIDTKLNDGMRKTTDASSIDSTSVDGGIDRSPKPVPEWLEELNDEDMEWMGPMLAENKSTSNRNKLSSR